MPIRREDALGRRLHLRLPQGRADGLVTQIAIQHQASGAPSWTDDGTVGVATTEAFVSGVVAGAAYNFRIASMRQNGAMSAWVEVDGYTVAMTLSSLAASTITSGTLASTVLPPATATTQGAVIPDGSTITVTNGVLSTRTGVAPVTPAAAPVYDGAAGTFFTLTLDRAVSGGTVQNLTPGQQYYFLIQQPASGVFPFEWPVSLANAQPVALLPGASSLQAAVALSGSSLLAGLMQYFQAT